MFASGFTLVELLVVIGIIAVLLSILLPVIGRVRDTARTTKCASNLRAVGQLLSIYVTEQRGSYPWGWNFADNSVSDFTDWASTVSYLANRSRPHAMLSGTYGPETHYKAFASALICPSVDTDIYDLATSYQSNPLILTDRYGENFGFTEANGYAAEPENGNGKGVRGEPGNWVVAPARASQLYPDNAVLWDTHQYTSGYIGVYMGDTTNAAIKFSGTTPDYIAESFIDFGKLVMPTITSLRVRPRGADPLDGDPDYAAGDPITIPFDAEFPAGYGYNQDAPTDEGGFNVYVGGARFRHARDTMCNVLFADGSVKGLTWDKAQKKPPTPSGGVQNEFLRKYLRIKAKTGVPYVLPF